MLTTAIIEAYPKPKSVSVGHIDAARLCAAAKAVG